MRMSWMAECGWCTQGQPVAIKYAEYHTLTHCNCCVYRIWPYCQHRVCCCSLPGHWHIYNKFHSQQFEMILILNKFPIPIGYRIMCVNSRFSHPVTSDRWLVGGCCRWLWWLLARCDRSQRGFVSIFPRAEMAIGWDGWCEFANIIHSQCRTIWSMREKTYGPFASSLYHNGCALPHAHSTRLSPSFALILCQNIGTLSIHPRHEHKHTHPPTYTHITHI